MCRRYTPAVKSSWQGLKANETLCSSQFSHQRSAPAAPARFSCALLLNYSLMHSPSPPVSSASFLCPASPDKWLKGLVHSYRVGSLGKMVVKMWPLLQEACKSLVLGKQKGIQDRFRYNWFLSFPLSIKNRQVNLQDCIRWIYFKVVLKGKYLK